MRSTEPLRISSSGSASAAAGDVDHDGVPDVIIGLSANGSTGLGPGAERASFRAATGAVIRTFAGTIVGDAFGQTVDTLGDIDGDGYADVIVGTAFAPTSSEPGYAKVFSGATGAVLYTKTGGVAGQRFGQRRFGGRRQRRRDLRLHHRGNRRQRERHQLRERIRLFGRDRSAAVQRTRRGREQPLRLLGRGASATSTATGSATSSSGPTFRPESATRACVRA